MKAIRSCKYRITSLLRWRRYVPPSIASLHSYDEGDTFLQVSHHFTLNMKAIRSSKYRITSLLRWRRYVPPLQVSHHFTLKMKAIRPSKYRITSPLRWRRYVPPRIASLHPQDEGGTSLQVSHHFTLKMKGDTFLQVLHHFTLKMKAIRSSKYRITSLLRWRRYVPPSIASLHPSDEGDTFLQVSHHFTLQMKAIRSSKMLLTTHKTTINITSALVAELEGSTRLIPYQNLAPDTILSQLNQLKPFTNYFFKLHINVIHLLLVLQEMSAPNFCKHFLSSSSELQVRPTVKSLMSLS
jgi:hypothetical protein